MSEDCLVLNVFTPALSGGKNRPVMVWLHGGGFANGSGHDLLAYDGESLARNHDAVVVTHNHRLNVYGYLNLEHLGGERYASAANVGMLDLVGFLERSFAIQLSDDELTPENFATIASLAAFVEQKRSEIGVGGR